MKRIQQLHLRNFKAFRNQMFDFTGGPQNPNGRHVLIYGGNGSGKSSIYWALYTLFETSAKDDVRKYFAEPDLASGRKEVQSLRNVDAPAGEPSSIELTWADVTPSGSDPDETNGAYRISATENTAYADRTLREASRSSDFVTYRLFQHFNGSNRHEVNVWPAFVRDIFPYYGVNNALFVHPAGSPFAGKPLTYQEALEVVVAKYAAIEPARTAAAAAAQATADSAAALAEKRTLETEGEFGELEIGEEATDEAAAAAQRVLDDTTADYENFLSNFNLEVVRFVGEISQKTNDYLTAQQQLPGHTHIPLQVALEYPAEARLGPGIIKALAAPDIRRDDYASLLRRDQPDQLLIRLTVAAQRPAQTHTIERPQTFLNEARLTQLAFALRVGALLDRNPLSRFNILCLDDVLLSLDMANRLEILDWLFSPHAQIAGSATPRLLDHYQVFFFTHDLELYDLVKYYAQNHDKAKNWYMAQLAMHPRTNNGQPLLFIDGDTLTRAKILFEQGHYAACATELRKITEGKLAAFLPNKYSREAVGEKAGQLKDLNGFIDGLKALYKENAVALGANAYSPFADLMMYKRFHLNPLSHHANLPLVMQDELWRYMEIVVPNLQKLKRLTEIPIKKGNSSTRAKLLLSDRNGESKSFRLLLGNEPIERITYLLPDNSVKNLRLDSICALVEYTDDAGISIPITEGGPFVVASNEQSLFSICEKIYEELEVDASSRVSIHDITITAV